jgi:hypothetical protein
MFNISVPNTYLREIEWVKVLKPDTENMIICCMLVACWFDKARKRHLEYIKNIKMEYQELYWRI